MVNKFENVIGSEHHLLIRLNNNSPVNRPPDKSAYWKTISFFSCPKHMLWVLKRTVSMRRFF